MAKLFGSEPIAAPSPVVTIRHGPFRYGPFRHMLLRHTDEAPSDITNITVTNVVHPSQLIDPPDKFEETHRYYSFMAVLAMMSLFMLITISLTGLLLGLCRKWGGSNKNKKKKGSETKVDGSSQFELNDIDCDVDFDSDVETKRRRGDQHAVCYYHLSDDDNMMDDCDDVDADYDDDDDEDGDMAYENSNGKDNGTNDATAKEKRRRRKERRHKRKWKKMRERGDYFHLYNNNDDDNEDNDDSWHQKHIHHDDHSDHCQPDGIRKARPGPKRSTTFPQLHNVISSCIRGTNWSQERSQYTKLHQSPTPSYKDFSSSNNDNTVWEIGDWARDNSRSFNDNLSSQYNINDTNAYSSKHSSLSSSPSSSFTSLTSTFVPLLQHHQQQQQHRQQQPQHIEANVQIRASNSNSTMDTSKRGMNYNHSPTGSPDTLSTHNIRRRRSSHNNKQQQQRRARNQRHLPSSPLHQHQQYHRKVKPRHLQHYASLSHHRHTKLHYAVKHKNWPSTHKRVPVLAWSQESGSEYTGNSCGYGGSRLLYKSHSIHAIPCSATSTIFNSNSSANSSVEQENSKDGSLQMDTRQQQSSQDSQGQCSVQIRIDRVDYTTDDCV